MAYQHLSVQRRGAVCTVRFGRPERRNALSADLMIELATVAAELRQSEDVAAIVLAGAGSFFSGGADIKDKRLFQPDSSIAARRSLALGGDMARGWETLPQVTIAAIEGFAIGGALSLALACDFRVAGAGSFFLVPEISVGASYGMNSVPRLVATVGAARAKRMVILEERVAATDALSWGMIDRVVADGSAVEEAVAMAVSVANKPRLPVEISKRAINAVAHVFGEISSHGDMDQIALALTPPRS
jgi:enoyl-CoA hydratase/carnithine racemase